MHMPQHNEGGYENASISNATNLSQNTRFLIMHGSADDNVHFQNTLTLLDKLDILGVHNYDMHVFPDSNHGIYFHHAYKMVHQRKCFCNLSFLGHSLFRFSLIFYPLGLSDWLVNAFNGEWVRLRDPKPTIIKRVIRRLLHR